MVSHVEEQDLVIRVLFGGMTSRDLDVAQLACRATIKFCCLIDNLCRPHDDAKDKPTNVPCEGLQLAACKQHRWWLLVGGRWKKLQSASTLQSSTAHLGPSYKVNAARVQKTVWMADNDYPYGLAAILSLINLWAGSLAEGILCSLLGCFVPDSEHLREVLDVHLSTVLNFSVSENSMGVVAVHALPQTERSAQLLASASSIVCCLNARSQLCSVPVLDMLVSSATSAAKANHTGGAIQHKHLVEKRCAAAKALTRLWSQFPTQISKIGGRCVQSIIDTFKQLLRDGSFVVQSTAVACMFTLIDDGKIGAATAMYLVKMLMYVLVMQLYSNSEIRLLIFANLRHSLDHRVDFPVSVLVHPLANAFDQYGYRNTDFELLEAVARHPQLQPTDAAVVLSVVLNVIMHDPLAARVAAVTAITTIKRQVHSPLLHRLLVGFWTHTLKQLRNTTGNALMPQSVVEVVTATIMLRFEPLNTHLFAATTSEVMHFMRERPDMNHSKPMLMIRSVLSSFRPHHHVQQQHVHARTSATSPAVAATSPHTDETALAQQPATDTEDEAPLEQASSAHTLQQHEDLAHSPRYASSESASPAHASGVVHSDTSVVEIFPDGFFDNAQESFQRYRPVLIKVLRYFLLVNNRKRDNSSEMSRAQWLVFTQTFRISQRNSASARQNGLLNQAEALAIFDQVRQFADVTSGTASGSFATFSAMLWVAATRCSSLVARRWTFSDALLVELGPCSQSPFLCVDTAIAHAMCSYMFDNAVATLAPLEKRSSEVPHAIPLQASLWLGPLVPSQYSLDECKVAGAKGFIVDILDSILFRAVDVHLLPAIVRTTRCPRTVSLLAKYGVVPSTTADDGNDLKTALSTRVTSKPRKAVHLQTYLQKRKTTVEANKKHQIEEEKARSKRQQLKLRQKRKRNKLKLEEYAKKREERRKRQAEEEAHAALMRDRNARRKAAADEKRRQKVKQQIADHHRRKAKLQEEEEEHQQSETSTRGRTHSNRRKQRQKQPKIVGAKPKTVGAKPKTVGAKPKPVAVEQKGESEQKQQTEVGAAEETQQDEGDPHQESGGPQQQTVDPQQAAVDDENAQDNGPPEEAHNGAVEDEGMKAADERQQKEDN